VLAKIKEKIVCNRFLMKIVGVICQIARKLYKISCLIGTAFCYGWVFFRMAIGGVWDCATACHQNRSVVTLAVVHVIILGNLGAIKYAKGSTRTDSVSFGAGALGFLEPILAKCAFYPRLG
jgi:hypothetical protein